MAEYIERGALMAALCEKIVGDGDYYSGKDAMQDQIRDMVSQFPHADVVPVRHGRWVCIRKGYGEYKCSVCHGMDSNCSDYYGTHVVTEQEYCPNCGAKMDEEETT